MRIGCPKEIKNREYRVGLTPESAGELVANGHEVWMESGAGAGIGALAGAAIGGLNADNAKERRRNILLGGLAGAAVGAAIGGTLDKQAADLQRSIGDDRVSTTCSTLTVPRFVAIFSATCVRWRRICNSIRIRRFR